MKKLSILAAFFCLFLAGAALAQNKTAANFAGTWELDAAKSKMGERMRVESGTLSVAQTDKQLTVTTDFKRAPRSENQPPAENNGAMREGGNRGGRGAMTGGGNGTVSYNLDGNETITEPENPTGAPSVVIKLKAETAKDGKLKLISTRNFETQMGAMTIKTVDVWELLDGGKTLKISRETETPRGSQSAEMYFTKRESLGISGGISSSVNGSAATGDALTNNANDTYKGSVEKIVSGSTPVSSETSSAQTDNTIKGGVLNRKALVLVQPEYPKKAKKEKIGGAVSVQVKIDEQGNVLSAKLVSGNPVFADVCEEAAKNSKFTPTVLSGKPVKILGIVTYNFIP